MPKANTPKLNDFQLVILSSASQRNDGLAVVPENVPTAPLNKALAKLAGLGFLKEVRVKHDQPLWRTGASSRFPYEQRQAIAFGRTRFRGWQESVDAVL